MIPTNWAEQLKEEFQKEYISSLKIFLQQEEKSQKTLYPEKKNIFNALRLVPFSQVKVVIMGQDPYHNPNQANGLAFSVKKGIKVPPSLCNIYKELKEDLGVPIPSHGSLESWAKQGVLLLNATLTVRKNEPKSHYGYGWERFTDAIIEKLSQRKDPLVFILWGNSAKEKVEKFLLHQNHPHLVITSMHPSPFSANGFFGTRPFSRANEFLEKVGKTPIDWRIPE